MPCKQIIKYTLFMMLVIIHCACGNRRGPAGGPVDNVSPEILFTEPLPFEQVENNKIVIGFSKTMDKTTVMSGLYVHPPKISKKITWKKTDLHINFTEPLPIDTNVIVFLSNTIKCERGNLIAEPQILTFKNGTLQEYRLAGLIMQDNPELRGKPINATLLDRDSLLVYRQVITGTRYAFENLNSGKYHLNTFIDMNNNNRFDYSVDAAFTTTFNLPITHTITINPVIADTVKPNIRMINSQFNNQINIDFNKELANIPKISIADDSTGVNIDILHSEFIEKRMYILTAPMDTLRYKVQVTGLQDKRGNERPILTTYINSRGIADNKKPIISETDPADGNVISVKRPTIAITFDKIIFSKDIVITLKELESNNSIPLSTRDNAGLTINYNTGVDLKDFNSYRLTIHSETVDPAGNSLADDYIVEFIVVPSG